MALTTARLALPYPEPTDNVDVPRDVKALTDALDPIAASFLVGLAGARPAAGVAGRFYLATDTGTLSADTGSAWLAIRANDPIPIGTVSAFAGAVAPTNWLLCDGAAVSRTTYATLFGICGSTFGAGDGTTTFNLPDLRGRSAIGAGAGAGLTNRALGAKGGEELHTLISAEAAQKAVSTGLNSADHTHSVGGNLLIMDIAGGLYTSASGNRQGAAQPTNSGVNSVDHTHAIAGASAANGHNTMHPFLALGAIVKAL